MKQIHEMHSHEIKNELELEQLRNEFEKTRARLFEAQTREEISRTGAECQDLLTRIQMLDPDFPLANKEAILQMQTRIMNERYHQQKNNEIN
jgi:hypothetical protein